MPGKIDIGGYFEQLTKRGRGGRRLDAGHDDASPAGRDTGRDSDSPGGSDRGGLGGRLKDVLGRGRSGAKRAADTVRTTTKRLPTRRGKGRVALPEEGVVTIEYSPRHDGDPDPGEVVWAWVPFEEDPDQGKDRPVVIIGRRGDMLVGIPLTTKRNDREAQLKIGTGAWDPKRRTSYARIWRMLDVDPDRTRREGAVLDMHRFEQLVQTVDRYYDVRIPSPAQGSDGGDDWEY